MSNPNTIQGGRWDEYFRRKFSLKGGTNTPELAAEILPTLDIPFELEDHYLLQDKLCWGQATAQGAGADFGRFELRNPAGSNKAIIIERMFPEYTGTRLQLTLTEALTQAVAGVGATSIRDSRWGVPTLQRPTMNLFFGSTATVLSAPHMILGGPASDSVVELGIVMVNKPNGEAVLVVEGSSAASLIHATFFWREIILDPATSGQFG